MKLSKISKVMDLFKITPEQLPSYKVDNLDVNRLPNTGKTPNRNPVATQVSLLREVSGQPKVLPLNPGTITSNRLTDDTVAVHVEFRYEDGNYQKLLLIK